LPKLPDLEMESKGSMENTLKWSSSQTLNNNLLCKITLQSWRWWFLSGWILTDILNNNAAARKQNETSPSTGLKLDLSINTMCVCLWCAFDNSVD